MEIGELVRLLRAGESDRTIMRVLGHNRRTVARYRAWAEGQGLLRGEMPGLADLHDLLAATLPAKAPPQQVSTVGGYREQIAEWRARGMEVAAIRTRLEEEHRLPVSYSAVWRLVRGLEPAAPAEAFVRVEVAAGSEAQVDFGYAGRAIDPATGAVRKAWVFVMVLSFSRHLYAEVVFDQKVETWLLCHRHAFEWFGGVPGRVVPDNLKAAIVKASFSDPVVQRSYRECAEHYGFLIDPNPPRTPHLKGKVEQGGVHYVKRNFLAGRDPEPVDELNRKLSAWAEGTAGRRDHGTTRKRPLEQFEATERAALLPVPAAPYDPATWKRAKVYRDCYLAFEGSFYSAPYARVGEELWVRGGARTVELYADDHRRVAVHDRAKERGERKTLPGHLPPEKLPGLVLTREGCQLRAEAIGPAAAELVRGLLAERPLDRLRVAGRLVGLAQTYTPERLEAACARAARFGEGSYVSVKRILREGLDREPPASPARPAGAPGEAGGRPPAPRGYLFARQVGEFVAAVFGGAR